jgi:hypothetical protein
MWVTNGHMHRSKQHVHSIIWSSRLMEFQGQELCGIKPAMTAVWIFQQITVRYGSTSA